MRYSLAFSDHTRVTGRSKWRSILATVAISALSVSLLVFNRCTMAILVRSSTTVSMCLYPCGECGRGPSMSVANVCPGGGLRTMSLCGARAIAPVAHPLQCVGIVERRSRGNPRFQRGLAMFCIAAMGTWFSRMCHEWAVSISARLWRGVPGRCALYGSVWVISLSVRSAPSVECVRVVC